MRKFSSSFIKLGMFKKYCITCTLILISSYTHLAFSQAAASATWALTVNTSVITTGNITATSMTGTSVTLAGYTAGNGVQTNQWNTSANPPTQTTEYLDFSITPSCGDLTVQSIIFTHLRNGTGGAFRLRYSVNGGAFVTISDITVTTTSTNYTSPAQSINVPQGQVIRFRLYGSTNPTNSTNLYVKNFVVSGTTTTLTPTVSIAAVPAGAICSGTSVTFTATPVNGGTTPSYQWKLNGANVGANSPTYINSALVNNDQVSCVMTSNLCNASPATATSNTITMTVNNTPAMPGAITGPVTTGPGSTGLSYSIAAVSGATSYNWTVPVGWTITAGIGTVAITVTSGAVGQNGNITVTASNSCGTSAASSLAVSIVPPHNTCNQCHINHTAPGGQLTEINGNSNLCINCHNPTGVASSKPFTNAMKAIPGTSGTSHQWDMAAVNVPYEANMPTFNSMLLRLPGNSIICSTCHNQHTSAPASPFLRESNTGDVLCKDCHSARNVGRYTDNPSVNKGSHPVGLVYNGGTGSLLASPISPLQTVGGKIECSSCHKTHYATSNDGNILRTNNNDALCTSCHTYGSHSGQGCKVCHNTHNTNKSNIYLIKDNIVTPNSGTKAVVFTAETGAGSFADGVSPYNGICEICHTTAASAHHHNDASGDHNHNNSTNCTTCHTHINNFETPTCSSCHNAIPSYLSDAHQTHTVKYNFICSTCHFNYGSGGLSEPSHPSGTANVNFDPNGLAKRNGADSNTPTWTSGTKLCNNVYCHSNGRTAYRGTDGTYTWSGTIGSQTGTYNTTPNWATGTITICTPCHAGKGNMISPYTITEPGPITASSDYPATGSHPPNRAAHFSNSQNLQPPATSWSYTQCFWCHETDNVASTGQPKFQGTYGTSFHVDGQTYFKPIWYSNSGTMVNTITYSSEGSQAHCGNGKTCW